MILSDGGGNTVSSMRDYANAASQQTGWDSGLIYAQWVLETGNFTSSVFVKDHNLAGIKWVSARNNPGASGPGVKANDGGYYAHYPNLSAGVQGYVNFIKANPRYANVKTGKTTAEQAQLLKNDGWATDPNYVSKVLSIAGGNKNVNVSDIGSSSDNSATAAVVSSTTGVSSKMKKIVSSPIFWVVLLAGLVFKS
jgi:flagellum-specific peptidoglycan hydrolase FlgJ